MVLMTRPEAPLYGGAPGRRDEPRSRVFSGSAGARFQDDATNYAETLAIGGVIVAGLPAMFAPDRRRRRDALPENTQYLDSGCDIHPSCLTCPLERCRYDEPGGARGLFARERDREIITLSRSRTLTVTKIARRFGISRRTVFRVLARERARVAVRGKDACVSETTSSLSLGRGSG
jgi:hypothetical protein